MTITFATSDCSNLAAGTADSRVKREARLFVVILVLITAGCGSDQTPTTPAPSVNREAPPLQVLDEIHDAPFATVIESKDGTTSVTVVEDSPR